MCSLFSHCVNTPEGSIILKEVKGVSSPLIELKWHSRLLIQRKQKVKPGSNFQYLNKMKKIKQPRGGPDINFIMYQKFFPVEFETK